MFRYYCQMQYAWILVKYALHYFTKHQNFKCNQINSDKILEK